MDDLLERWTDSEEYTDDCLCEDCELYEKCKDSNHCLWLDECEDETY